MAGHRLYSTSSKEFTHIERASTDSELGTKLQLRLAHCPYFYVTFEKHFNHQSENYIVQYINCAK